MEQWSGTGAAVNVKKSVRGSDSSQNTASAGSVPFAATAYGEHLQLVLDAALAWQPALFSAEEHALAARLRGLALHAGSMREALARLAQRVRPQQPALEFSRDSAAVSAALAAGWLERVPAPALSEPEQQPARWRARNVAGQQWLSFVHELAEPWVGIPAAARQLVRAALAVAFADGAASLSTLVRLVLDARVVAADSPLARSLAGARTRGPSSWADRWDLDGYLEALKCRALCAGIARSDKAAFDAAWTAAYAEVAVNAGAPLQLIGYHLTAVYQWTQLLWSLSQRLPLMDERREQAVATLIEAPLSPGLTRAVWTAIYREQKLQHRGKRLARQLAKWGIWSISERQRWQERGRTSGKRRQKPSWPVFRWRMTLSRRAGGRSFGGNVLADGELVEAATLARFQAEGWQGVHAEGSVWLRLAEALLVDAFTSAAAPTRLVWCAPLMEHPIDAGRWGFGQRREAAIAEQLRQLAQTPDVLCAAARDSGDQTCIALATAAVRLLPRPALVDLFALITRDPHAAAGLPDLVVWNDEEINLWEVKSPNDALSDAQVWWLTRLNAHGVVAGVVWLSALVQAQSQPASE